MLLERKQDLSVYYWLVDQFSDADFINIEDGFPSTNLDLPTIALEVDTIDSVPFQLGTRVRKKFRRWYIDVFADNKSQRDEYAYRLINSLESTIAVYDYDEGFPPDVSPTQLGYLDVDDINLRIIKVMPELTEKLYYRSVVTFSAVYATI